VAARIGLGVVGHLCLRLFSRSGDGSADAARRKRKGRPTGPPLAE
jgi:hypothetical protein